MHSPKKNPASANWTGSSKATQPENHMNDASGGSILPADSISAQSHAAAAKIATAVPDARFCGFNVSTANGKVTKRPMSLAGPGVGVDTPAEYLCDAEDVLAKEPPPSSATYWGVVLQKHPYITQIDGQDHAFVILDLDTKASTAPRDIRIAKLLELAREMDLLTERSHSQKGGHIMFMSPADEAAPKRIKLGNSQEIEIFGLANSAGKSVMLTGDKLKGGVKPIQSLIDLLHQAGITDDVIFPPEPTPAPVTTHAVEYTPRPMDDMDKAQQALSHISIAKGDYQTWIDMGMALQHGFGAAGYQLWVQWSSTQPEFKGEEDCKTHWKSFKPNGATSLGTLFHLAKQHGYRPPTKSDERRSAVQDFQSFIQAGQEIQQLATTEVEGTVEGTAPSHWPEINIDLTKLKPTRYLIDNFWGHGFMVLAGQPGLGKTNAVLSLSMVMAGFTLSDSPLKAKRPRKTIIVTEDSSQVIDTLYAYKKHFGLADIQNWIVVIDAKRSDVKDLLQLSTNVLNHTVNGIRPHLILDTANSTMDLENENDNSEVGSFMAALKQTIYHQLDTPITIITHTPKTINRQDADAMARGASAFTGDATQTSVLFIDDDKTRYLRLAKLRYEPKFREVRFESHVFPEITIDQDGDPQEKLLRVAIPYESSETDRESIQQDRQQQAVTQRAQDKADEACAFVQSILNDHPEGVVIRKGKNAPRSPDNANAYRLDWNEVFSAIPGSSRGDIKSHVVGAVFARFAPDAATNSWVELHD
jgi:RecA-family ATPase